jgi:hypothetical protein
VRPSGAKKEESKVYRLRNDGQCVTHLKSQRLRKKMADMDWMYELKKSASKLYQPEEMVER